MLYDIYGTLKTTYKKKEISMENLLLSPFIIPIILLVVLFFASYVKASPNKAFIISGIRKEPKVLIGRAGLRIPFFEKKDSLNIGQVSIDIKTNGYIPTMDFIGVDVDAVAKVHVITEKDVNKDTGITAAMAQAAMRNFLNLNDEQIRAAVTDSLQGNMREIIGTQTLKGLCNDRKQFGDEVQVKAQVDMNKLGLKIDSCNIQKITDEKNLINALGQDNMAQIQKDASIAKANADKEVKIRQAEAEKEANDARVKADTEISIRNNELKIKQAELKMESDTKEAAANAAYGIQEQEQRKTIEIATTNANIAKQEREIELKKKEAEVKEQELSATIRKQADADKYKRQQEAEANLIERQKEAEAKRYEQEKEAEALKISADAKKYEATQQAEAIKAKGLAEADAIKAKGLAEAEATEKKAEAMAKMKEAAILEMYFKVLPDIAANVAKPLQAIDKITMYGEGNTAKLVEDITKSTTQISEGLTASLGVDLKSLMMGVFGTKAMENLSGANATGKYEEIAGMVADKLSENHAGTEDAIDAE